MNKMCVRAVEYLCQLQRRFELTSKLHKTNPPHLPPPRQFPKHFFLGQEFVIASPNIQQKKTKL